MTATNAAPRGTPTHRRRERCRACDQATMVRFLELGPQPLANAFLRSPAEFSAEAKYPLDLYLCSTCGLVQLADVIDPEVLFRNYLYVTGTSQTIADHNTRYAQTVRDLLGLTPTDLVVEVASNDGSLLRKFRDLGVKTLGVEPARNIAAIARERGIATVEEFFGSTTAVELARRYGQAKAVIGNNVLAHVDDTQDFLRGAASLVAEDGLVITEVPYLGEFVARLEYDTVYHEHLCYFSISSLARLCESVGLRIVRVDSVPVHGGSIRMYAARQTRAAAHGAPVLEAIARERDAGLTSLASFATFADGVRAQRTALVNLLRELKASGKRIAAYGAPAKGNTLLNYCGITSELVDYTVDRNPLKVGMFTPGSHLLVKSYDGTLLKDQPDYVLILAWNFADEIMKQPQEQEFHARGGKFIVPIPSPKVI